MAAIIALALALTARLFAAEGDVSLKETETEAILDNGILRAVIQKSSGRITSLVFQGMEMTGGPRNPIYYSFAGGATYEQPSGCVFTTTRRTPDLIDVSCKRTWREGAGYKHAFDIDLHYVLRRGDSGLYAYSVLEHPTSYPETGYGEWRVVWKLPRNDRVFALERAYVDAARNGEMPSVLDYAQASPTPIKEIVRLNTGVMAGRYDGKYSYSARYFETGAWGHASNHSGKGAWIVLGGQDYLNDGPTKQDLTLAGDYSLLHFGQNHYNGSTIRVAAGEAWRKQFGPYLFYCNQTEAGDGAGDALWADARERLKKERAAWPYDWLNNADYPARSERGSARGRLVVRDPLKPGVSAAGARIGLAEPEETAGNWQFQGKGYQYWTVADADGNFTLPDIRPGIYTLYAFNDGMVGEYSKRQVEISKGRINDLGQIEWDVAHPGERIAWEIGVPDRTAREFRHGDDYFTPFLWNIYVKELPDPLVYTVGASDPAKDWNYVQSSRAETTADEQTRLDDWLWEIRFRIDELPRAGDAHLTIAFASAQYPRLWLHLNGDAQPFTRINPPVTGGNALLRQGIHAKYSMIDIRIPVSRLREGENTFGLRFAGGEQSAHVMYDYLRLELPGAVARPK